MKRKKREIPTYKGTRIRGRGKGKWEREEIKMEWREENKEYMQNKVGKGRRERGKEKGKIIMERWKSKGEKW